MEVAVKIPRDDGKDLDYNQFRNEFNNLMKVKHDNIVKFLGYCYEIERTEIEFHGRTVLAEETHRALCFEYLHNGSLQKHLYNESCGLDWNMRYKIIKGTCEGLRYIHEEKSLLHLDLKPDNILLDKDMPAQRKRETVCGMIEWDNKRQETSFEVGNEPIVGREEKKKRIASSLEGMTEKIVILPIFGIGGIGKTTFARLIYNDISFKYYSQVWVYVSPRFDLCKIGNSIISQLSGKENQANELRLVKIRLAKLLSGKKVLIVLDDLWEKNTIRLVELKEMLDPGDSIKTIVLVTTRSEDIAKKMCINIEPHKIEALTDEMCWDIIKQKSDFQDRHDKEKLACIGKDIARKCGGVALAAQTLGSVLQSMAEYDQWMGVRDNDIWSETMSKDASSPNHVLASLKLSYVSMDDCLKSCFTYCAIFPKGHKIVKHELIYQWISLDFIKQPLLSSTLQLCENYIQRLMGLTFLQHSMPPTTYRAYGEHETVLMMHDLVHDLAVSLLGDQILDQSKQVNIRGSSCHYALLTDCSKPLESCTAYPARLSALRFMDCQVTELYGVAFEPAESLRVLDLSECSIQKLPDSVGRLKQLRYLNAPRIWHGMVPKCITKLSNLRYLSLRRSCSVIALPESIGEMEDLVHLDLSGCIGIEELPESFGNLTSLEHVDFTNCRNITGVSQCLARLTKLKYLNLSHCKNIGDLPRALGGLTELRYLNLSYSSYLYRNKVGEAEFLGSLAKLKYLNLSSKNDRDISWLPEALGSLTELMYLNLSHHPTIHKLPASFGNLCNLVHLDLSRCCSLRDLPAALNGLTKLQYLDLYWCSKNYGMDGLQEGFGKLTKLRHLNLGGCIGKIPSHNPAKINGLLWWICTLTNLEYLSLRENNSIYSIPETLANLKKLRTLDLSWCRSLQKLPASISEIESLKFLYTKECSKLDRFTLPRYRRLSRSPPQFVAHAVFSRETRHVAQSGSFLSQLEDGNPARLKLSRLENVKTAKEARIIKLVEKTDITHLTLEWASDAKRSLDDDAEVLRELEPPYSVLEFRLQGYNSVSFPSWVMQIGAYLPDLTKIAMQDIPNCKNLPPLGQLPNLESLEIAGMNSIKKIDASLYGGTIAFPRLRTFILYDMKCLEEWNEHVFPHLTYLGISHCPRLRFKPRPTPSTKDFRADSSNEVLSSSSSRGNVSAFTTRCSVHVEDCESIASLPDSIQLTSLQSLVVFQCPQLVRWCKSKENKMKLAHVKEMYFWPQLMTSNEEQETDEE
ncbi:unnamed protein product [Urochloa decumbens]|uniref:Protein kinase domain-containing protein n=1 Tax=Urochloa decumbens TaxID=240449 RepID=A0ABC9CCL6_9POAL